LHVIFWQATIAIHVSQLNLRFPHSADITGDVVRCLSIPAGR
jgi:hypothetical protein